LLSLCTNELPHHAQAEACRVRNCGIFHGGHQRRDHKVAIQGPAEERQVAQTGCRCPADRNLGRCQMFETNLLNPLPIRFPSGRRIERTCHNIWVCVGQSDDDLTLWEPLHIFVSKITRAHSLCINGFPGRQANHSKRKRKMGLSAVDGLLHRIQTQSPSTSTYPVYVRPGAAPTPHFKFSRSTRD